MTNLHITLRAAQHGKAFFEPGPRIAETFHKFFDMTSTVRATVYLQDAVAGSSRAVEITRLTPCRFRVVSSSGVYYCGNYAEAVNVFFSTISAHADVPILVDGSFKLGDVVEFTNEYGVTFGPYKVTGFSHDPDDFACGRTIFLDTESPWFPVEPESLKLLSRD